MILIFKTVFISSLYNRPGACFSCFQTFSHPKALSKISNFMITELFYSHIFNVLEINRSFFHTRRFRRVFRWRLTKNGSVGPECFRETSPRLVFIGSSLVSHVSDFDLPCSYWFWPLANKDIWQMSLLALSLLLQQVCDLLN